MTYQDDDDSEGGIFTTDGAFKRLEKADINALTPLHKIASTLPSAGLFNFGLEHAGLFDDSPINKQGLASATTTIFSGVSPVEINNPLSEPAINLGAKDKLLNSFEHSASSHQSEFSFPDVHVEEADGAPSSLLGSARSIIAAHNKGGGNKSGSGEGNKSGSGGISL